MSIKSIPLKEAYAFGNEKGLTKEINEIKNMEIIKWDKSYTSGIRRGCILNLFKEKGIFSEFIKKHWNDGETQSGLAKQNSYIKLVEDYKNYIEDKKSAACPIDPPQQKDGNYSGDFIAESDLRNVLAANLSCIESGLRLYQNGETSGIEFSIDKGRIDILAIDSNDEFVVIELKLSRGRNSAIGQLLYYMGWVDENLSKSKCRGIIVAKEITPELALSTHRTSGISLFRYNLQISVEPVQMDKVIT
jgi:hypothetical protein